MKPLLIDGSYGEGGGQILRTSIALSAITGVPIKIVNIRKKRKNPGLRNQHITSIKAVASVCGAKVEGLRLGSTEVTFYPQSPKPGKYFFDVGTAGSVTLVLQSLLPVLSIIDGNFEVKIRGGTDVPWSPPIDYLRYVLRPILSMMGFDFEIEIRSRGFYPAGGGEIIIKGEGSKLKSVLLEERGKLVEIGASIWLYNLPDHILERMRRTLMVRAYNAFKITPKVCTDVGKSLSPGTGVVLYAQFEKTILGADRLGEKGVRAETVAIECVNKLEREVNSKATLDIHAADQVQIFMSLANGTSSYITRELSNHAQTNMWVISKFLGNIFESIKFDTGEYLVKIAGKPYW